MDVPANSIAPPRASATRERPNVLLVFPRFNQNSFWSLRAACEIYGARCPAPPLGLITVAALLPPEWNLRLVDRNAEELGAADLAWADLVFTGGMLPQRVDCLEVIDLCQAQGKTVVIGGPDATSSPHLYDDASHLVLGEAEVTLPAFLKDFAAGTAKKIYQDAKKADVQTSPTPRSTNVTVEPRAPVSSTGTFLKRSPTNFFALSAEPNFFSA